MGDTATSEPGTLLEALLNVQRAAPDLQRDKINPHFRSKYLSLEALHEQILPLLAANRLVWVTLPTSGSVEFGDEPALRYELIYVGKDHQLDLAERIAGSMKLSAVKDDPQGQGSAITYARRYSLMAVLGLVADEDDDGNAASGGRSGRSTPTRPRRRASAKPASSGGVSAPTLAAVRKAIKAKGLDGDTVRMALVAAGVTVDDGAQVKDILPTINQEQGDKLLSSL